MPDGLVPSALWVIHMQVSGKFIVRAPEGATVIGGGEVGGSSFERALARAPVLVAADGGAARALELGRMPMAVIGDMDSLPESALGSIPADSLHRIGEQDSTDFAKCVRSIDAPIIVGVGVLGPRMDHGLAALNVLALNPGRRLVLLTESDLCFLCPPKMKIELPVGSRVSLFPMRQVTGTSIGLRWKLDGLRFSPDGLTGTSNEVSRSQVAVGFDEPGMLMILPAVQFDNVLDRLSETVIWRR